MDNAHLKKGYEDGKKGMITISGKQLVAGTGCEQSSFLSSPLPTDPYNIIVN